jgi:hypothetical protein
MGDRKKDYHMPRHAAHSSLSSTYDITELDADGIGQRRLYVGYGSTHSNQREAEQAARLLVLAMNLPGGIDEAILLLRAELARQS